MPRMTATVDFVVHQAERTLLVPVAALNFKPKAKSDSTPVDAETEGSHVFCVDERGRLRLVNITTGQSDGIVTEVVDGSLKKGEMVAIGYKQDEVSDSDIEFSLFGFMRQGQGPGSGQGRGTRP